MEQQNKGTKDKGTKKQKVHPIGSGITRSPGLVSYWHILALKFAKVSLSLKLTLYTHTYKVVSANWSFPL
jgi:hypothetical protein